MKSLLMAMALLFAAPGAFAVTVFSPVPNCSSDDLGAPLRALKEQPAAAPLLNELANYNYEVRRELMEIGDTVVPGSKVEFAVLMAKLTDQDLIAVDGWSCVDLGRKFTVVYLKMLDGEVKALRFNTILQ